MNLVSTCLRKRWFRLQFFSCNLIIILDKLGYFYNFQKKKKKKKKKKRKRKRKETNEFNIQDNLPFVLSAAPWLLTFVARPSLCLPLKQTKKGKFMAHDSLPNTISLRRVRKMWLINEGANGVNCLTYKGHFSLS